MRPLLRRRAALAAALVTGIACARVTPSTVSPGGVEQTQQGSRPPASLLVSFDGLGVGLQGPHGRWEGRNPSDNSLAVGRDYVFQIVNTRMAISRKNGEIVYGPVPTNTAFKGFGGACEAHNNGDAVVRYDQLADRWLIVMPVFTRSRERPDQPPVWKASDRPVCPISPDRRRHCSCRLPCRLRHRRRPTPHPEHVRRVHLKRRARSRCAMRSARAPIRSAHTIA